MLLRRELSIRNLTAVAVVFNRLDAAFGPRVAAYLAKGKLMKPPRLSVLSLQSVVSPFNFLNLPPRDPDAGTWNVIIETPQGCRGKFDYDPALGLFKIKKMLPLGSIFPFDFGFLPSTLADD